MINRALIIRKLYIDKILSGEKVWEMRSTRTNIRGRIGLIEAGSGLIVGEVDLETCFGALDKESFVQTQKLHCVEDHSKLKKWKHPWQLANPVRYDTPIPYTHPKGAVIWVKINPELMGASDE